MSEITTDAAAETAASEPRSFLRRYLPAIAFFAGFLWDAATLGRRITSLDLLLLSGYFTGACVAMLILGRANEWKGTRYVNAALQFLLGGIFSALVIFYFLSSGDAAALGLVSLLTLLLVLNEFLDDQYARLTLAWLMFTVSAVMLLNFALPHLFRSFHWSWFYISTGLACAVVLLLRRFTRVERASIIPSMAAAAVLVVLQLLNVIPPVPLVQKEMIVAHDVTRIAGNYRITVEPRTLLAAPWSTRTVRLPAGRPLYCFTAVFVPRGIETTMSHQWLYRSPQTGEWQDMGEIPFPIRGGRNEGYRAYTFKKTVPAGEWLIRTVSADDATIGSVRVNVIRDEPRRLRTIVR